MKKSLFSVSLLFAFFFVSCARNGWDIKEVRYKSWYYYRITSAPEEYANQIGHAVFYYAGVGYERNDFHDPHKKEILSALNKGDFTTACYFDDTYVFLNTPFLNTDRRLSGKDLAFMYKNLQTRYIGFADMVRRGFTEEEFFRIRSFDEMSVVLDTYVNDTHFSIWIGDLEYRQPGSHDEGCAKSADPYDTYFEKETSNAYYIRLRNCTSPAYFKNFGAAAAKKASQKKYIVLDARSNFGGNFGPVSFFRLTLTAAQYGGTLFVLQDNWSFSAGELWREFGSNQFSQDYKLVGTHSGGAQTYGDIVDFEDEKLQIWMSLPTRRMDDNLPSNYLGEGQGYEPEIWATTQTMKHVLEGLGVDLEDIVFR